MKAYSPTGSYRLSVPDDVVEKSDGEITSYWRPYEDVALQLSSRKRVQDQQVTARERLQERFATEPEIAAEPVDLGIGDIDNAASTFLDKEGYRWFYIYVTWPDLAVFATVIGPPATLADPDHWTFEAIRTLCHA